MTEISSDNGVGLCKFPSEILGDILVFLPTPTLYNLWLCGDTKLHQRIRAPNSVRYFGLHWNLMVKPITLCLPSLLFELRYLRHLSLGLTHSFRSKPIIVGFDFLSLPTTLETLILQADNLLPIWKSHAEAGWTFDAHFESLQHLDITTNGLMVSDLFLTLPHQLTSLRLKMTLRAAIPSDMALLPPYLRQLRLEDSSSETYPASEMGTKFPSTIEHLHLFVAWAASCFSFPPNLVSFTIRSGKPLPFFIPPRLPSTVKQLVVSVNVPLVDQFIPLLPPRLEYLEWRHGTISQKGIDMLPRSLTQYDFLHIDSNWRLPDQLQSVGMSTIPLSVLLPSSLQLANVTSVDEFNVKLLPAALKKLWIAKTLALGAISALPSNLHTLSIGKSCPIPLAFVELFPSSLTSLSLQLESTAQWDAQCFSHKLVELNMTAHVRYEAVVSLKKLKSLISLVLFSTPATRSDTNTNCFQHLPRALKSLYMPITGTLDGDALLDLPQSLTEFELSTASDDTCSRLTLQDFQLRWPRSITSALIPRFSDPQFPAPSRNDIAALLPPWFNHLYQGSYSAPIYSKAPAAQEPVNWDANPAAPKQIQIQTSDTHIEQGFEDTLIQQLDFRH